MRQKKLCTWGWEYRPDRIVYLPVYIWYCIKSIHFGSIGRVGASNPGMPYGGFVPTSKRETLKQLPTEYLPATLIRDSNPESRPAIQRRREAILSFPCIVKADVSQRSQKIYIAYTDDDIFAASTKGWGTVLIQAYIQDQAEFGITYYRLPHESQGHIFGIMKRGFAYVIGNGQATLEELIHNHPRYNKYTTILYDQNKLLRKEVIHDGEKINIMPFGAHSKGTIFEDYSTYITPLMEQHIDRLAQHIDGFYIGRFDIKSPSVNHLAQGIYSVLEVNGVGGIPAHMYDPRYTLRTGWRILFSYRNIVSRIIHLLVQQKKYIFIPQHTFLSLIKNATI